MKKYISRLILILFSIIIIIPTQISHAVLPEFDNYRTVNYDILEALEIFDDDAQEIYYSDGVERAAFIHYILKAAGISVVNGEHPFVDLPENHIYRESMITAYKMGIINENSGYCRPSEFVTLNEASKIIMCVLGYAPVCENTGGYPVGYTSRAARMNIINSNGRDMNAFLTPIEFDNAILEMLHSQPLDATSFSQRDDEKHVGYKVAENDLLWNVHKIRRVKGVVESTYYSSVYGKASLSQPGLLVNSEFYYGGSENLWELLGRNICLYYRHNDDTSNREIVYAFVNEGYEKTITITGEKIDKANSNSSYVNFYDESLNKNQKLNLKSSVSFIYNMELCSFDVKKMCGENARVTFVDNDTDGKFDVISVLDYEIVYVKEIHTQSYGIFDFSGTNILGNDMNDVNLCIRKDGKVSVFSELEPENVIAYASLSDGRLRHILASSKKISGMVDMIDTTENKVTIDGVEYDGISSIVKTLSAGDSGMFALDVWGRIANYISTESETVYGYLNNVSKGKGVFDQSVVRIFTENNRWVTLELNDKIQINGNGKISSEDFLNTYSDPSDYRQLITYTVNDKGICTAINFPKKAGTDFERFDSTEQELIKKGEFRLSAVEPLERFRGYNNSFGGKIALLPNAKVFLVPDQSTGDADLEDFEVITIAQITHDKEYKNIRSYDANEAGLANICVVEADLTGDGRLISKSAVNVVSGDGLILNEDKETRKSIILFFGDEKIGIPVTDECAQNSGKNINAGDIIQYVMNSNGEITYIKKYYDSTKGYEQKFAFNSVYTYASFVAGRCITRDVENNMLVLDYGDTTPLILSYATLPSIFVYNSSGEFLRKGTVADMRPDSYAFVRMDYFRIQDIIIFE